MNAAVDYQTEIVEEQEVKLSDYLAIIKRRKLPFIGVIAAMLVATIGIALMLPPVYRSTAVVLVKQQEMAQDIGAFTEQVDQSVEYLFRSVIRDSTLEKVIEKFDLYSGNDLEMADKVFRMEKAITVKTVNPEIASNRNRFKGPTQMAFEISFDYMKNAKMAQQVTGELVSLFMNENFEKRKKITQDTTAFLSEEAVKIEKKVALIEEKLSKFKEKNSGLLPDQVKALTNARERAEREILSLDQQISSARSTAITLQGQLSGLDPYIYKNNREIRTADGDRLLSTSGRLQALQQDYHAAIAKYSDSHPKVKKIRNEILSLGGSVDSIGASPLANDELELAQNDLIEARQKYSDSHPQVKQLERKVERLSSQANVSRKAKVDSKSFNATKKANPAFANVKAGVSRAQAELDSLIERQASLREKLKEYDTRVVGGPEVEREYNRIVRERDDYLRDIGEIKKKLSAAERAEALEQQKKGDSFDLIEPAQMPRSPIKPNRPAIVLLGGLLSLGIAFALVILLESLDESITSRRSLVAITGAQPIGMIPAILTSSDSETIQHKNTQKYVIWGILVVVLVAVIAGIMMSEK